MTQTVIRVDAQQYADVRRRARDFSPLLAKALTKALKDAGKIGADLAKDKIRAMPSYGTHSPGHGTTTRPTFLRAKLAANIRVQVRSKDVRIVQGATGISGHNARGLPRRIDEGGRFRHPVFGREPWASQLGYSYFRTPIEAKRPEMEEKVRDALERALRVIAGEL